MEATALAYGLIGIGTALFGVCFWNSSRTVQHAGQNGTIGFHLAAFSWTLSLMFAAMASIIFLSEVAPHVLHAGSVVNKIGITVATLIAVSLSTYLGILKIPLRITIPTITITGLALTTLCILSKHLPMVDSMGRVEWNAPFIVSAGALLLYAIMLLPLALFFLFASLRIKDPQNKLHSALLAGVFIIGFVVAGIDLISGTGSSPFALPIHTGIRDGILAAFGLLTIMASISFAAPFSLWRANTKGSIER